MALLHCRLVFLNSFLGCCRVRVYHGPLNTSARDLVGADAEVVKELELAGVRFMDNDIACSAWKRVVAKVNWNSDRNHFAITAISVSGITIDEMVPYLGRFENLHEISASRSRSFDSAAFKRRFPYIQITSLR